MVKKPVWDSPSVSDLSVAPEPPLRMRRPKPSASADRPLLSNGSPDTPHGRFVQRREMRAQLLKKETAQETLALRMMTRLDVVQQYLEDDETWFKKLEKTSLRDIAIMEGVWIDKLQLLTGKATQTIAHQHQEKLDQLLPLLQSAIQQRGLDIGLTERTIEFKT